MCFKATLWAVVDPTSFSQHPLVLRGGVFVNGKLLRIREEAESDPQDGLPPVDSVSAHPTGIQDTSTRIPPRRVPSPSIRTLSRAKAENPLLSSHKIRQGWRMHLSLAMSSEWVHRARQARLTHLDQRERGGPRSIIISLFAKTVRFTPHEVVSCRPPSI